MRITNGDIASASCITAMDGKDANGGPAPVTDLKFSPTNNDATNSNGILSPPTTPSTATPSENEYNSSSSNSGRFKFYKDGKFILELWHHKNGERMFWIPVSKNSTCWPPMGHCTPRQESSTSLSVSDDNSSIQSSPWQRDHCWKQAVPRKNINRELEFMMHILRPRKMRFSSAAIRKRRRRPYDTIIKFESFVSKCSVRNPTSDGVDAKPPLPTKVDAKPVLETENLIPSRVRTRRRLSEVLQKLLERRPHECPPPISSCRTDPGIVSPRKRILKEMEKVSLEELGNVNKKHRARTVFSSSSTSAVAPCTTVTVITGTSAAASSFSGPPTAAVTATTTTLHMTTTTTSTKSTNSHSISSILSRDEEQPSFLRNLLKSPSDVAGVAAATGDLSAASSPGVDARDVRDVRDTADIRASQSTHSSTPIATLASPPPLAASASSGLSYPTATKGLPSQQPSLHPPPPLPPMYITPAFLYPGAPQPFLTSPPMSNHPPYYSAYAAAGFRDPTPMWPVPPVSSLSRQSVYPSTSLLSYPSLNPSPWVPVVPSSLQSYQVSESGTDVPLNLSKH